MDVSWTFLNETSINIIFKWIMKSFIKNSVIILSATICNNCIKFLVKKNWKIDD